MRQEKYEDSTSHEDPASSSDEQAPIHGAQPHQKTKTKTTKTPKVQIHEWKVHVEGIGRQQQTIFLKAILAASECGIARVREDPKLKGEKFSLADIVLFKTNLQSDGVEFYLQLNEKSGRVRVILLMRSGSVYSAQACESLIARKRERISSSRVDFELGGNRFSVKSNLVENVTMFRSSLGEQMMKTLK